MNTGRNSHLNVCSALCALAALLFVAECYCSWASRPTALGVEAPRCSVPAPEALRFEVHPMAAVRLDGRQPFMPWREPPVVGETKKVAATDPAQIPVPPIAAVIHPQRGESAPLHLLHLYGIAEACGRRVCLIQTPTGEQCSLVTSACVPGTQATVLRIEKQSVQIAEQDVHRELFVNEP
jgi:hypothetical protein